MSLFFELIKVALGNLPCLSKTPEQSEWNKLFIMSQRQTVAGVAFEALDKLDRQKQKCPLPIFYEWLSCSEQIKWQNQIVNQRCVQISEILTSANFDSCILKGQGNALMYPNPMSRQPGDIDIWVDAEKKDVVKFVRERIPEVNVTSHHVDFPIFNDVPVEIHFVPTYMIVRRRQKKLDQFIEEQRPNQFSHSIDFEGSKINVPCVEFNIILQLLHMQRHFFNGGIGLRQVIDFYYLLKSYYISNKILSANALRQEICDLGLETFSGSVMWVLHNCLGMDLSMLIMSPDKNRGELLQNEIIKTGNFGQYDQRSYKKLSRHSMTLSVIARNLKMVKYFPEESISAPIDGVIRKFFIK